VIIDLSTRRLSFKDLDAGMKTSNRAIPMNIGF
jgi:hypothetical protein